MAKAKDTKAQKGAEHVDPSAKGIAEVLQAGHGGAPEPNPGGPDQPPQSDPGDENDHKPADTVTLSFPLPELTPAMIDNGVLMVRTKRGSRRRAGHGFGPEETAIPLKELSADEVDAIAADPVLTVSLRLTKTQ
ncbi:MAG: hypothetical protein J0H17_03885 [Rhizobiales bacterium]|nr:hypothetical protein [Hyphomicrobiales bacterium]